MRRPYLESPMSESNAPKSGLSRRSFLGTAAITGAAGLVAGSRRSRTAGRRLPPAARPRTSAPASWTNTMPSTPAASRAKSACWPAVDARAGPHSGLQPLQRHRLGPHQRKPQDPDRGPDAGDARLPEGQGRRVHQRRRPPPAPVLHRPHLRRALSIRQRQGQQPRRAHPPGRDEDGQDRRAAQRVGRARPAAAIRAPAMSSPTASTSSRCPTMAR